MGMVFGKAERGPCRTTTWTDGKTGSFSSNVALSSPPTRCTWDCGGPRSICSIDRARRVRRNLRSMAIPLTGLVVAISTGQRETALLDLVDAISKPGASNRGQIQLAIAASINPRMDLFLGDRGGRIELHAVGFDPHDCFGLSGQADVRNLRQHRVGQVLDHQRHAVRFGPTQTQDCTGLRFASFQCHAGPT